jgi:alpha-L-fucosidase 2
MRSFTRRGFLVTASSVVGSIPFARRFGIAQSANSAPDALTIWYTHPANQWVDALPIGNGRLGAMVYGGRD